MERTDAKAPPLHRLGKARRQEGITRRTVARRLGISVAAVKQQEIDSNDIPLSLVYEWQKALGVPMVELLKEPDDELSTPLAKRARLVRVMKTVLSIMERATQPSVKRMAQTLINQLVEMMPELKDVSSWHLIGLPRSRDDYGRAVERCLPDDVFMDGDE